MTALSVRPDPVTPVWPGVHDDRRLMLAAAVVALLLHGLVILLPLPERTPAAPPPPIEEPIVVQPLLLVPPAPPQRREAAPPRVESIPVPMLDSAAPERPAEPVVMAEPPLFEEPALERGWSAPPAPPPLPAGPVDETTPGLIRPVPLARPEPEYPHTAVLARLGGIVVLRAVIDTQGHVVGIEVLRAPRPDPGFSEAAIEAVSGWRYEPGRLDGRPVPVSMTVVVTFELQ